MNVNRFFRKIFKSNKKLEEPSIREPFWNRLPPINLPNIRLPDTPPIHLPNIRLPEIPAAKIRVPSLPNPFANFAFIIEERQRFFITLNWLGYILIFASALDYFLIFYPPQLTDPRWELQTLTNWVNNSWFFLLGLILVFLPTRLYIRRFELNFLSLLRGIVLLWAIFFILLLPLGVINTQRINTDTVTEINREQAVQQRQLEILEQALTTRQIAPRQLQQIAQALGVQIPPNSQNLKGTLIEEVRKQQEQIEQQANATKQDRFQKLIRESVRTHFGALLIAFFLFRLWWETRWVKVMQDYVKEQAIEETP